MSFEVCCVLCLRNSDVFKIWHIVGHSKDGEPPMKGTWSALSDLSEILGPYHISEMGEAGQFVFGIQTDRGEYLHMHDRVHAKWVCSGSRDIFIFRQISDKIS